MLKNLPQSSSQTHSEQPQTWESQAEQGQRQVWGWRKAGERHHPAMRAGAGTQLPEALRKNLRFICIALFLSSGRFIYIRSTKAQAVASALIQHKWKKKSGNVGSSLEQPAHLHCSSFPEEQFSFGLVLIIILGPT